MARIEEHGMIQVAGLTYSYGRENVLQDVSCQIHPDRFTVIMGKNGSGKSTLLRLIGGLIPYHSGSICMGDQELASMPHRERARWIGFLGQHHRAVFPFTVEDVVQTGRSPYIRFVPGRKDKAITEEAMELAGILSLRKRIYSELSGGEQQLVLIGRLLAQQARILLLDEPISHLDYNNQLRVIKLIRHLVAGGKTVIAVLHDPNMAYLFGQQFIYVHDRKVHEVTGKAWEHDLVGEIFHHELQTVEHGGKCLFFPARL